MLNLLFSYQKLNAEEKPKRSRTTMSLEFFSCSGWMCCLLQMDDCPCRKTLAASSSSSRVVSTCASRGLQTLDFFRVLILLIFLWWPYKCLLINQRLSFIGPREGVTLRIDTHKWGGNIVRVGLPLGEHRSRWFNGLFNGGCESSMTGNGKGKDRNS